MYIISVITEITVTTNKRPDMNLTLAAIGTLPNPSVTVWTYLAYLAVSVALTVWVAKTLHKNGRIFLVDNFLGNEALADSVNHLLVVGFYLINIGFVTLALKYGDKAFDAQTALEILSSKVGLVLVVLGIMHFFNLAVFSMLRLRKTAQRRQQPPHIPQGYVRPLHG
ncbi:MAG: hypothetical protein JWR19_3755 [Pedosphaera sp.]|nr:hypothetical protein [Pedosphaera sp.]